MERATKRERNEGRLSEAPEAPSAKNDRFFTDVFVMVDDQTLRTARLALMKRLEGLILQLADVSEIVAEKSA